MANGVIPVRVGDTKIGEAVAYSVNKHHYGEVILVIRVDDTDFARRSFSNLPQAEISIDFKSSGS